MKPRARRRVARLGRSTGSDYTRHGVSLADDQEVSTYHGKFESSGGNVYFTDVGSTNGSVLNERDLAANDRQLLRTGDVLRVGASDMRVRVDTDADGAASASTASSAATRSTAQPRAGKRAAAGASEDEDEDEDEEEDDEVEGAEDDGGEEDDGAGEDEEEGEKDEGDDGSKSATGSRRRRAAAGHASRGAGGTSRSRAEGKAAGGSKRRTRRG